MDVREFFLAAREVIGRANRHTDRINKQIAERKQRINQRLLDRETKSREAWGRHEQTLGDWKC